MSETYAGKVARQTRERDIGEALVAGDISLVNAKLDHYPYGQRRPDVSLEVARYAIQHADKQPTEEFEAITPEMIEGMGG